MNIFRLVVSLDNRGLSCAANLFKIQEALVALALPRNWTISFCMKMSEIHQKRLCPFIFQLLCGNKAHCLSNRILRIQHLHMYVLRCSLLLDSGPNLSFPVKRVN